MEPLAIAQVLPYPWEADHALNAHVRGLAAELARRGHRVLIAAPSDDAEAVREGRAAVQAAAGGAGAAALLPAPGDAPRLVAVGEVVPLTSGRRRPSALPIDVSRTIEDLLEHAPLDVVHVHEPFAPSTGSAALRHSRALNVGSFHAPTERVLSAQLARRVVEVVLGRLDARLVSSRTTGDIMGRLFPADYRLVVPAPPVPALPREPRPDGAPPRIAFLDEEERPGLRLLVRALRRLPRDLPWEATIWTRSGVTPAALRLREDLSRRVRVAGPEETTREAVLAGADVLVNASGGTEPAPWLPLAAIAAGAVPLSPALPVFCEHLADGERGLLFEPRDAETLAAQLERLLREPLLRERLREGGAGLRARLTDARVADEVEAVLSEVAARRHDPDPRPEVRRRIRERPVIDVDLHMHTDHSGDCAVPVEALLATAKARGLGAIAVTDHNEISGALEAERLADGIKVIVAEEVKTADQGEVIGLFIRERIPRGMTLQETIAEIRRQDGLVYVPHPFDRMHAVPDYEHLLDVVEDVDAIEVYNARVAIGSFNEEAVRFAAKYRIVPGAGSDAHVLAGLGSVRIRMRDFDGPEEFLESLRDADIIRQPANFLYVQALKFLQTKATPEPAQRAVKKGRVRRAERREARARRK